MRRFSEISYSKPQSRLALVWCQWMYWSWPLSVFSSFCAVPEVEDEGGIMIPELAGAKSKEAQRLRQMLLDDASEPFKIMQGPLLRVLIVRVPPSPFLPLPLLGVIPIQSAADTIWLSWALNTSISPCQCIMTKWPNYVAALSFLHLWTHSSYLSRVW